MANAAPSAAAPTPVMDVVAPPVEKTDKKDEPTGEIDPVDQLAAEDQKARQAEATAKVATEPAKQKPAHQHTAAAHSSGVGMAITATVIIVLALATLATYAYLQTNK